MSDPTKIEIWTGSHITNTQQLIYLEHCLASSLAEKAVVQHRLSVSSDEEFIDSDIVAQALAKLRLKYGSRMKLFYHDEEYMQIEHFAWLIETSNSHPDQMIMILDDDDLLLGLPPKWHRHSTIRGYQWVPPRKEDDDNPVTRAWFEDLPPVDLEELGYTTENNLSGYACQLKVLQKFIKDEEVRARIRKLGPFADTVFMKYIHRLNPYVPKNPFIYHRLWRVLGSQPVIQKTCKIIADTVQTVARGQELLDEFEAIVEQAHNKQ